MSIGNPHVALNKRMATLEAELAHSNQCYQEMTARWQESHDLMNYFYNACVARDQRIASAIKQLEKYKKDRDRALAKNPTNENLIASTVADTAFLKGKAALEGEQHGASVQFPREGESGTCSGSNGVGLQGEKTNASI